MAANVTVVDIRQAVRKLGISGRCVCAHSSLRSFGHVQGAAAAVVRAFLDEGCTLLVTTFSYQFGLRSQAGMRPPRNAWQYDTEWDRLPSEGEGKIYTPDSNEIAREMGAVPAAVLAMPGRVRGMHPLTSLSGVGPHAAELVSLQTPLDAFAPLEKLAATAGFVLLMGVGLDRLTLLHLAERAAGRTMFRRWANGPDGQPMMVEFGGCSSGFGKFERALGPVMTRHTVGQSPWVLMPAREALHIATAAIKDDPAITACGDPACERCRDGILGGPILNDEAS